MEASGGGDVGLSKRARRRARRRAAVAAVGVGVDGAGAESEAAGDAADGLREALRQRDVLLEEQEARLRRLELLVEQQAALINRLQCDRKSADTLAPGMMAGVVCPGQEERERTLEERVVDLEEMWEMLELDDIDEREEHMNRRINKQYKALSLCLKVLGLPRMVDDRAFGGKSVFPKGRIDVYSEKEEVVEAEIGFSGLQLDIQDINSRLQEIESELRVLGNQ